MPKSHKYFKMTILESFKPKGTGALEGGAQLKYEESSSPKIGKGSWELSIGCGSNSWGATWTELESIPLLIDALQKVYEEAKKSSLPRIHMEEIKPNKDN